MKRVAYRVGTSKRWEWRLSLPCEAIEAPAQIRELERMGYLAIEVGETATEFDLPRTWDMSQPIGRVVNTYGDGYCQGRIR